MKITFSRNYDILKRRRRYCSYIFSEICVQFVHVYSLYTYTINTVPCKKKAINPLAPCKVNEHGNKGFGGKCTRHTS
jgi:hypothetical protein